MKSQDSNGQTPNCTLDVYPANKHLKASHDLFELCLDYPELGENAKQAAGEQAAALLMQVISHVDANGLISDHYDKISQSNDGIAPEHKRHKAEAAAHFAGDVRGALDDGTLSRGLGGVSAYLINLLLGRKPEHIFESSSGQGNKQQSILAEASRKMFIQTVFYLSQKQNIELEDAFVELHPAGSFETFENTLTKYSSETDLNLASNAGRKARLGTQLPRELLQVHINCEHFLSDGAAKHELVRKAYRLP